MPPPVSLASLVSYWPLNEASGTRFDAHGTNHLTDNNTVTQGVGVLGNAAQFTLTNGESLSHAGNASMNLGDIDFTYHGWVYLSTKATYQLVIDRYNAAGGDPYCLQLYYDVGNDRFRFRLESATTDHFILANSLGSPAVSTWYFLVVWYDATAHTINIQANDGSVDSTAHTLGTFATLDFVFGAQGSGLYFNGRMDEWGFWKRVLTSGERTTLYNGGAGLAYPLTGATVTKFRRGVSWRIGSRGVKD